ncbi:MAG TPA: trehalose-phosphatase [Phycisphaerales bacterium]|nr:trehalose-phosphatase [Phycisphaerales bacterium]
MDLSDHLEMVARTPVLLVASDYDGTLAPIVSDPSKAVADRESIVALRALAQIPSTHVAVISGRSLKDLAALLGDMDGVLLVGSHGSEFDVGFADGLGESSRRLMERLRETLEGIAEGDAGFGIEIKPASVAFHYRNADESRAARALESIDAGPASWDGVYVKRGKKVVELGVVSTNKGDALETIRKRVSATACVFLGDDVTDEDAFATLKGPDLGVKVGPGASSASFRIGDSHDVAKLLARLTELRLAWAAGAEATPIEEHAMLSDQRTVALVDGAARVVWMCAPRSDSSAIFAELVGGPTAGYFAVGPARSVAEAGQRYLRGTNIVETRWGSLTLTDYLDCAGTRPTQRAGRSDLVRVIGGAGKVKIEFAPRLDFGRVPTQLIVHDEGLVVEGVPDPIVLRAPGVTWRIERDGPHDTAIGEAEVIGKPIVLELRYGTGDLSASPRSEHDRRTETDQFWSQWLSGLEIPEVMPELVRRSALALRGLVYGPTGGMLAAATTSLPEDPGGVRNWDYRYCWLRDAAISCEALVRLGSNAEAIGFLDWVLGVLDRTSAPERLAPVYSVIGSELGAEAELPELPGYMGSKPVRVGNGASTQLQLDVFGPVVELVWQLLQRGAPVTFEHWQLVEQMVQAVERRWREPDHGIWEVRVERRHWVHSKVMCWVTIDRAMKIAERYLGTCRQDWQDLANAIRDDVCSQGYNQEARAFTAWYGSYELDASVLLAGTMGLIDPNDERFVSTVRRIEEELLLGPAVFRYKYDDGLPGGEGGFNFCTCWLIDAYLAVGRVDEAWALFNRYTTLAGPTGLIPEEYNVQSGHGLGNHPQAYSHAGLIFNALKLAQAGEGAC